MARTSTTPTSSLHPPALGRPRRRWPRWPVVLVALAFAAAACSAQSAPTAPQASSGGQTGGGKNIRIVMVTHGEPTSGFWNVVKNGAAQAAKDLGITVEYRNPDKFDMQQVAQLIDAAVASKPDGLAVAVADPDALGGPIRAAVQAGIPVVTLNSGLDAYRELGALTHVGSDEAVAGKAAGERFLELGVTNLICVNDEVGNIGTDTRCKAAGDVLTAAGKKAKVVPAPGGDSIGIQNAVAAALQADPSIDGVLTMGPETATPALKALKESGRLSSVKFGTFDLGVDTLNALIAGEMVFAVDQQQYLQGYLPPVLLMLYKQYLLMPGGGGPVLTGPNFVTKETAAQVLELSKQGIR